MHICGRLARWRAHVPGRHGRRRLRVPQPARGRYDRDDRVEDEPPRSCSRRNGDRGIDPAPRRRARDRRRNGGNGRGWRAGRENDTDAIMRSIRQVRLAVSTPKMACSHLQPRISWTAWLPCVLPTCPLSRIRISHSSAGGARGNSSSPRPRRSRFPSPTPTSTRAA